MSICVKEFEKSSAAEASESVHMCEGIYITHQSHEDGCFIKYTADDFEIISAKMWKNYVVKKFSGI